MGRQQASCTFKKRYGLILGTRAFLIYKAYYQIFKEEDIRKLANSD